MKEFPALALVLFIASGNATIESALITVDLLMPVDPEARRGETADDFEAAKRILQSTLERLWTAVEGGDSAEVQRAAAQARIALALVGELGGYNSPYAQGRSVHSYGELVHLVVSIEARAYLADQSLRTLLWQRDFLRWLTQ